VLSQNGQAVVWEAGGAVLRVEPWGRDAVRVRAAPRAPLRDDLPGALLAPNVTEARVAVEGGAARLENGALTAVLDEGGLLRFLNGDEELLAEAPQELMSPPARRFRSVGGDLYHLEARFQAYAGERLYGLGQHAHGRLDQKGCVIALEQRNTEVSIPFLLSSRGYGLLWNNPAVGRVELAHNGTRWVAEATRQLDYWVVAGGSPRDVLRRYHEATGFAPMMPEWATGFWQSKLRYQTPAEVLEIAREHVRRELPLSVIVIDFFHWPHFGDWRFDPEGWPDPAGLVRELAELGVRAMVSVWPTVNARSETFETLQARGWLVGTERGVAAHTRFLDRYPEGPVYLHFYDATHPEARRFVWGRLRDGYYRHGLKVYWLDACEPEFLPTDLDHVRYHLGSGLEVSNLYPREHARGVYEGLKGEGEGEVINLCRSAWAGSQRYGAALWSGDIPSTFEALQAQVRAGLNVGLSGMPWWNSDIGGYHSGDPSTPYFRELVVRWFQFGAFCPLFRLHGHRLPPTPGALLVGAPNEIWGFGDEAYAIIREVMALRERLRPYVLEQMRLAHEAGLPPMRPLFFEFPEDPGSARVEDAYLFGPDLLVAPVLHEGVRQREVYLPAGERWRDAWTDERYEGGRSLTVEAPLARVPLFVRGDAALPIRGP